MQEHIVQQSPTALCTTQQHLSPEMCVPVVARPQSQQPLYTVAAMAPSAEHFCIAAQECLLCSHVPSGCQLSVWHCCSMRYDASCCSSIDRCVPEPNEKPPRCYKHQTSSCQRQPRILTCPFKVLWHHFFHLCTHISS